MLFVLFFGMWYNFGEYNDYDIFKVMILKVFDYGIIYFDFVNNYGLFFGYVEIVMGCILNDGFIVYRDEIIIFIKVGFRMYDGFY